MSLGPPAQPVSGTVCVYQMWKEDVSGSMLAKLWLLVIQSAGLGPSAVQTYNRLLALLAVIGDDFAIYFFTFLITHLFLSP